MDSLSAPERVQREVARRLRAAGAAEAQVRAVTELAPVEEAERAAFWGESLPVGLSLAAPSGGAG
jgi:hypothetical protein